MNENIHSYLTLSFHGDMPEIVTTLAASFKTLGTQITNQYNIQKKNFVLAKLSVKTDKHENRLPPFIESNHANIS